MALNPVRAKSVKRVEDWKRYISRPALEEIFKEDTLSDRKERNRRIKRAVNRYGYSQKEISDHLRLYYTMISRIVNEK